MSQSRFSVDHVCLTADKPFEGFKGSFEQQLGLFRRSGL
jgi:hypothetical protein